jgi:hypothetical protein
VITIYAEADKWSRKLLRITVSDMMVNSPGPDAPAMHVCVTVVHIVHVCTTRARRWKIHSKLSDHGNQIDSFETP